jgi:GNAT superfamily N-acetyltransferase
MDVRRDLNPVADLMEGCFSETLDPDGQRYLQQMRTAANNPSYLRWAAMMAEGGTVPISGYVWEEDGQLVGNLTLIPYFSLGRRYFLAANVAVHPEYRRKGIATSLTLKAIEHARQRGGQAMWLHVRAENEGAVRLYRSLGFIERARRTTWVWDTASQGGAQAPGISIEAPTHPGVGLQKRRSSDWRLQRAWLERLYPAELRWHLSLKLNTLRPDLWGSLNRFLNDIQVRQWSVWRRNQLLGVLAWQSMLAYADSLWLATTPEYEESVVGALLRHARTHLSSHRPLSLDYPAGHAGTEIQAAGFRIHQTLIWMSMDL